MDYSFVFFFISFPLLSMGDRIIHTLEANYCNNSNAKDLVFILKSHVSFNISLQEDFCIFENANVTITSATHQVVNIYCASTSSQDNPTQGFAFVNSSVTITRIAFINCGIYLTSLPKGILNVLNNSSPLYYPSTYASALVFLHCEVRMDEVMMNSSYGLAIIGFNLNNSLFESSHFTSTVTYEVFSHKNITIGSGLLLHFGDSTVMEYDHHVAIVNSTFSDNFIHYTFSVHCIKYLYGDHSEKGPFLSSAALSVFYTNKTYTAHVSIEDCKFLRNVADTASSIIIVHFLSAQNDSTSIINSKFTRVDVLPNSTESSGSAEFTFIYKNGNSHSVSSPLKVLNVTFENKISKTSLFQSEFHKGTIYIGIFGKYQGSAGIHILLSNVNCSNFKADKGVCFIIDGASQENTFIKFQSVTVSNNILASDSATYPLGIISSNRATLIINGTKQGQSLFQNNFGSVFHGFDTTISLYGYVTFKGNRALSGAAINLQGNSHLYFMKGFVVSFEQNEAATLGGAIYAVVNKVNAKCAFSFNTGDHNNASITFLNNSAANGGSSIYASPIFNCSINESSRLIKSINTYNKWFHFKQQSRIQLNISTKPSKLKIVSDKSKQKINVFPGEEFAVCLSAEDAFGQSVYASVAIYIALEARDFHSSVSLQYKNTQQVTVEGINCTKLTLSFRSVSKHWTEPVTRDIIFQLISNPDISATLSSISLYPCPVGFSLHEASGFCGCSEVLYHFQKYTSTRIECDIQTQTITRMGETNSWAGMIKMGDASIFAISSSCSIGYCQANDELKYFYSNMNGITLKESPSVTAKEYPQCVYERDGPLCGQCSNGRSVVLGSTECYHCSDTTNYWLFSFLFMIAGPVFITLLYTLKLTLKIGTLNGIVFYANVMYCAKIGALSVQSEGMAESIIAKVSLGFLATLNLDTQFPLCFFKGMGELWKPVISMLFPIYLLSIVILVIILNRYSMWLSNRLSHSSLQVLITVLHFSFAKLLVSIIHIFSSATIITSEGIMRVWYHDGTIHFLQDPWHRALAISCSLIVFPIVLFYLAFLLFTKHFSKYSAKCSLYLRPVYESIHAPFKEGKECLFVTRLLTLMLICLLDFSKSLIGAMSENVAVIVLLCIVLVGQLVFNPYKSRGLNLLDNWSLVNIILVHAACVIWYTKIKNIILVSIITTTMMLATFIIVIVYHILFVTDIFPRIKTFFYRTSRSGDSADKSSTQPLLISGSFNHQSLDHHRELLLDY